MTDVLLTVVKGATYGEFSRSLTAALQALPRDIALQLDNIRGEYVGRYGLHGLHMRMNNRTVTQIFAEYTPTKTDPIASGEVDGLRYQLYEARGEDAGRDAENGK